MESTSVVKHSSTSAFDHQQVAKNKRKKFNPKYMLTNSSSDDDEGGGDMTIGDAHDQMDDGDRSGFEDDHQSEQCDSKAFMKAANDISGQIPSANFSINKTHKSNNSSPPPPANVQTMLNPFLSPSKLSLLQTFNLQQQQQLFQQAAISAIAPQFSQQLNSPMNLSETEAKFREFAFKTMQELLSIYGLSLPPNEILEAMKNQQMSKSNSLFTTTIDAIASNNAETRKLSHSAFSSESAQRATTTTRGKFNILIYRQYFLLKSSPRSAEEFQGHIS
jgi:hypothetical protein